MADVSALFATGISGLDAVLGGGFHRRSLVMIVGAPGAGKTVLASHILFNAARNGLKTLVCTAYSEGNDQYIEHIRSFGFFEAGLVGDAVQMFSLGGLGTSDNQTPATSIANEIRRSGAKVVLLDGFQGAELLLPAQGDLREVLSALASQIRYLDVMLLVTMAGEVRDPSLHTALTVADTVVGLHYTLRGLRHRRRLEVMKQRGHAQWAGLHSYQLDAQGVQVFPRLEGYPPVAARPQQEERAAFGLAELDELLGGGLSVGTTTLLAGAPGVGKTTLGLLWALADARPDVRTLFVSFSEHADQLVRKAHPFGLDLQAAQANGSINILRVSPVDLEPDQVAAQVLAALADTAVCRIVIDDVAVLVHELGNRTRDYLSALSDMVYHANVTCLYLLEIAPFEGLRVQLTNTPLAVLGDNVIVVQQYEIQGQLRRFLAVLRMRFTLFDRTLRELVFSETSVRVLPPSETTVGVLETGAQLSGGVAPAQDDAASSG